MTEPTITVPKEEYRRILDERNDLTETIYARREDLRAEKDIWQNSFFGAFGDDEKISISNVQRGLDVADMVLEEFKRRFQ